MKIHIILLITLTLTGASTLRAQDKVVAYPKRMNLLNTAEDLVDVSDAELFAQLDEMRYPFEFEPEKVVAPPIAGAPPPPPPEPKMATPEEVLNEFASRLQPTGMLIKDGKGILILAGGSQLVEGNIYRVNYQGKPFNIVVTKVASDSYTLTIDEVTITRRFGDAIGTGITSDRN